MPIVLQLTHVLKTTVLTHAQVVVRLKRYAKWLTTYPYACVQKGLPETLLKCVHYNVRLNLKINYVSF